MDLKGLKFLVVGSGFFGAIIAERIANDLNEQVLVIDKRSHIGGNCYSDKDDETGIFYHKYGTHIFHTSSKTVWKYINNFTEFNGYYHQVLTTYKDHVFQMPINLETINSFYNINLKPYEVDNFLEKEIAKENITNPRNFEEKAISLIGKPLYEAFIKGYTEKQWAKDPSDLPESILKRLPFRKNYNESYYFDRWQGIPLLGYTEIFNNLLDNKNIDIKLKTDYFEIRNNIPDSTVIIYSGPIDQFFDHKYGKLEWRTIDLKKRIALVEDYQGTSVMNYAEKSIPYTRIHEPRHLHPELQYTKEKTLLFEEYSKSDDGSDPFYPISDKKNKKIFFKYSDESQKLKNVIIGGRLGDYKYFDMDKSIEMALESYEKQIKYHRIS